MSAFSAPDDPTPNALVDNDNGDSWDDRVLNVIRGVVRPFSTFALIGATIWFAKDGLVDAEVVSTAAVAAFSFWFGGRINP